MKANPATLAPPIEERGSAAALLEGARAALERGDLANARAMFATAHDAAIHENNPVQRARAALGRGGMWLAEEREDDVVAVVRSQQVAARDALDPHQHRGLWLSLSVRLEAEQAYLTGEQGALTTLLDQLRDHGDPAALAEGLSLVIHARLGPEYAADRIDLANEMRSAASRSTSDHLRLVAACWVAGAHAMAGHIESRRSRRLLERRCAQRGSQALGFIARAMALSEVIAAGRFDEAEREAADVLEAGIATGDIDAWTYYFAHLAAIRYLQGRGAEVAQQAHEATSSMTAPRFDLGMLHVAAMFALEGGDASLARRAVAAHRASSGQSAYQSSSYLLSMLALAIVARDTQDRSLGAEIAEQLAPYRGLPIVASLGVADFGPVERAIGLALHAAGEHDAADASLAAAVERLRISGASPMAAIALSDRALVLLDAGRRAEAMTLLTEARDLATALHMNGWLDRWSELLAAHHVRSRRPRVGFDRLGRDLWTVRFDGHECVVPDKLGMGYVAVLCANPGVEVTAGQLAYGVSVSECEQPLIDRQSIAELRNRRKVLQSDLEAVGSDGARRGAIEDELDAVVGMLVSLVSPDGRPRSFTGSTERARTSVRKAIVRAIADIEWSAPLIAEELRRTVQTGSSCVYRPD